MTAAARSQSDSPAVLTLNPTEQRTKRHWLSMESRLNSRSDGEWCHSTENRS
jgi:hypothetical protein